MKLNNKGFALTSMIYMLIVLFLMIMLLVLSNLAQRKVILDKIRYDVKNKLDQGVSINANELPYQNETTGIYYETLELAFNKSSSGDTIKVLKDVTDSGTTNLVSGKNTNLNLNGKTITMNQPITNNGTMTITGSGKIISSENISIIQNNGELNLINNLEVNSTTNSTNSTIINDGILTIDGAKITSENYRAITNGQNTPNCNITLNDGTIIGKTETIYNYRCNANTVDDPSIKILGGTITSSSGTGLHVETGMVTIGTKRTGTPITTTPTITGKIYGIKNISGTINFYNGKIIGENGTNSTFDGTITPVSGTQVLTTMDGTTEIATLKPIFVQSGALTILDASNHGNGNIWTALTGSNGTINNGTWGTNYLEFNGTSTWVNLGSMNSNYQSIEVTLSISQLNSTRQYIISNLQNGGGALTIPPTGTLEGLFNLSTYNANKYTGVSTTIASMDTVYHVVATYDGSKMKLYINGNLEKTQNYNATINPPTSGTNMILGGTPSGSSVSNYFNGKIYSAAVYNRALTADEVYQNYVAGMYVAGQTVN